MSPWLNKRRTPPPSDKSGEVGELEAQTRAARQDAERFRALLAGQAARVHRIHEALTHEGRVNHFTQRWAEAVHRGDL